MLRRVNRLSASLSRTAATQCGAGGEIYGPEHFALQEWGCIKQILFYYYFR